MTLRQRFWSRVAGFAAKRTGRAFVYGASVNLSDLITPGPRSVPTSDERVVIRDCTMEPWEQGPKWGGE